MATDKPRERRNPIGPTARTVGANVRRLRQELGDTQSELSKRLKGNGHPIPVASIGRIESGDRRVEVDDLVALSISLGVSPLALLLPYSRTAIDKAELTGWSPTPAIDIWRWALAGAPLAWESGDKYEEESLYLTIRRSFPWWLDPRDPEQSADNSALRALWDAKFGRNSTEVADGEHPEAP